MSERIIVGKEDERIQRFGLTIGMVGCLASGKTTLAAELGRRWGLKPVEENYPENPFLARFYENPSEFSFKSQVFFLTSKVEQLLRVEKSSVSLIDPSLTMDFIYAKTHHKMGWMNDGEWNLYQNLFNTLSQKENLRYPDMHIVVLADQQDLQKRIVERDRPYEMWILKNYPEYLAKLSDSVEEWSKEKHKDTFIFIANTSAGFPGGSVGQLADRIESHILAHFGLNGRLTLPNIKPNLGVRSEDYFPGISSESLRFAR